MKQLTLQHLAAYLPYGLQCEVVDNGTEKISTLTGLYSDGECVFADIVESEQGFEHVTPLLRPLDQLTQPINEGGREFVPILELARMACPNEDWSFDGDRAKTWRHNFGFDSNSFWLYDFLSDENVTIYAQLELFQKLFEWKMDVFGLIESGLALPLDSINDKTGKE